MTTSAFPAPTARTWPAALLLAASLVPALVAALPLTMNAVWYLSADENEPYLTTARVGWMLGSFVVAVLPFVAALVAVVSVRVAGHDWPKAFRVAAAWAVGLGVLAFLTLMTTSGGL